MFELKKIITAFLMPLPAMLLIGFFGLALVMFTRKHKSGCIFIFISLASIFAISFQPVSTSLLKPLERKYTAFLPPAESLDYVMVLGSGHVIDPQIPPTSELSRTALMRLSEGIRILRMYPGAKLILSGYDGGSEMSQARMMATVALALGVAKSDIILLETAQDTWEEARQAAGFVGEKHMSLVTSASHMERALREFHSAGLNPTPAPTNYLAQSNINQAWQKYTPQARYLEQTERYWHETMGKWWKNIRDLVSSK
ncbi:MULTISPECIES: envelope biogenesis factor ElyC [Vibrio]|uniref:envelope biogenesis factor ElyC n=1 Tax=Vibrio TaxID=662 RepID=UPI00128B2631|nr:MULTISPECIES: envelope biogenesis factor ElyC [Vibrio]MPW35488.1 envelope biogenesis factor ElyC [Vibrio sp. B1Z05]